MSIVTVDGGLTALGYGLSILAAALFFFIAGMISRNQKQKSLPDSWFSAELPWPLPTLLLTSA